MTRRLRGWGRALVSVAGLAVAALLVVPLFRWAVLYATWSGSASECRAHPDGACWAFVGRKLSFIVFGLYPPSERWRALGATVVLVALVVVTARPESWRRWFIAVWVAGLGVAYWLMRGGVGLAAVPTRLWGGLPITLMLTALGLAAGFPGGVLLALGRRSRRTVPRAMATAVVEVVRGVPLIAVLYVAALVVPLLLPSGVSVDKLLLAQAGVAVFAAAYLSEAVRAGLQMVPRGQEQAALALGLRPWTTLRRVVLPQSLRISVPSFVTIAIGFFQDTSLVVIIGLFDLLNTSRLAAQDSEWLGFHTEAYAFAALAYFIGSAAMSRYGLWLERRLGARLELPARARLAASGSGDDSLLRRLLMRTN